MTKQSLSILLIAILSTGCYSTKKTVKKAQPYSSQINWPENYQPADADFYVHNKLQIKATPDQIWELLIHAENWPDWYEGMSDVEVLNSKSGKILENSELKFSTMGQDFEATIREFEPYSRLAWETTNKDLRAYHAWLIIPNENGCLVITDEVQIGKLAKLQKVFLPNKLRKLHDQWLAGFNENSKNYTK